ncbi:TonB-dependent receptor [Sphingopyxis lindanitolerans]|uniref:TonB-dependent receptor n=1 Tax=Sphingopyxis lindanitolerans TaxID=2054227 RepID=A0A2S8B1L7_9SPHN|nr:TonB-dependent receptor [Sphingopyxis lindanitolerans]PQM26301.1 TonB-dependent receptor [Sphingopyxis lindanitolerans]
MTNTDPKPNGASPPGPLRRHRTWLAAGAALAAVAAPPALAQSNPAADAPPQLDEIIVTAQKREESANSVPMSISVATASDLEAAGVIEPRDLGKIATSFNYTDSYVGSPIYTLRGVGFSDISLGGRPTVSIYVDEAPIPFAIETRGANLDLERVEILKGPQGTLFGQNATGGAINYIAAKPTREFEAGLDASYGRFDAWKLGGYVSGPLSNTLSARLAVEHRDMGPWQRSYTSGARNGREDFTNGRFALAFEPSSSFRANLTISGFIDQSDVQAGQAIAITPSIPAAAPFVAGLLTYPLAPANARAADFNPGGDYARDNHYFQGVLRLEQDLSDSVSLTSLTSYSRYRERQYQDIDGTTLSNIDQYTDGRIRSISQELRLAAKIGARANILVGGSYSRDKVLEDGLVTNPESTVAYTFVPFGLPLFESFRDINNQRSRNIAIFGNGDVALTDSLRLYGGVRYSRNRINYNGCTADAGDGVTANSFGTLLNVFRAGAGLPPVAPIAPGGCFSADAAFVPGLVVDQLKDDSLSWRAGIDWKPADRILIYANVSKGYKAGSFPTLAATLQSQLEPAVQESLIAYEAGFKGTLADRTLQVNGAIFHYDYRQKQFLGKVLDPVFGPLIRLANVPKSRISGAELEFVWAPARGFKLSAGGSYIDSKILDNYTGFDATGAVRNFGGEPFPNTPKWHGLANADYQWSVGGRLDAFVGAGMTYQGKSNSQLGELPLLATKAYTLVDLRAGVEAPDGRWRFTIWGRNVGNAYYWTAANANLDTTVRFAGMPATYGATLSLKLR